MPGPLRRCLALCFFAVGLTLLLAPIAYWLQAGTGLLLVGVAATVCLGGAVLGEFAASTFPRPEDALIRMLVSMLCRSALPMATLIGLTVWNRSIMSSGGAYYFVAYYLLMLGIEARLAVVMLQRGNAK